MRQVLILIHRNTIPFLLAAALLLEGCARSAAVSYYQLSATKADQTAQQTSGTVEAVIGIGPVHIAGYLDRPQIVSRISSNRLQIAENSRWAEPLEESIPRILLENLEILLPAAELQVYPWDPSISIDYQLLIGIARFDATADGTATLEVHWQILQEEETDLPLEKKHDIFTASADNNDQEAKVHALSMTLEQFSRELANEIKKVVSLTPQSRRPQNTP